jgi:hypothetical protein
MLELPIRLLRPRMLRRRVLHGRLVVWHARGLPRTAGE